MRYFDSLDDALVVDFRQLNGDSITAVDQKHNAYFLFLLFLRFWLDTDRLSALFKGYLMTRFSS